MEGGARAGRSEPRRVEVSMVALRKKSAVSAPKNIGIPPLPPEERARQRLRAAVASLGVSLSAEEDSDLVAEAAAAIVTGLVRRAAADPTSDDVIFAAGVFTQASVAHFAKSLRTRADVALLALANLTESLEEFARVHPAIVDGFASFSRKQPKLAAEIGDGIGTWTTNPGAAGLADLVQLFRRTLLVCRSSRVAARAMV